MPVEKTLVFKNNHPRNFSNTHTLNHGPATGDGDTNEGKVAARTLEEGEVVGSGVTGRERGREGR